jgi:hypothetical protein
LLRALRQAQGSAADAARRVARASAALGAAGARRAECCADYDDAQEAKRSLCRQLTHLLRATEVREAEPTYFYTFPIFAF